MGRDSLPRFETHTQTVPKSSGNGSVVFELLHLGLGRGSALSAALFLLNNGHGGGDKLDAAVAAVGAGVQLAVVVQVVLSVELVFAAEFTREAVGALAVETKVMLACVL